MSGAQVLLLRSLVAVNDAGQAGGCVGLLESDAASTLTTSFSQIVNGYALDGDGGGVFAAQGLVQILDTLVQGCYAARYGGAVASAASLVVKRSLITECAAQTVRARRAFLCPFREQF
eukprot:680368-Pleurochrysis_carterae.AAC.3